MALQQVVDGIPATRRLGIGRCSLPCLMGNHLFPVTKPEFTGYDPPPSPPFSMFAFLPPDLHDSVLFLIDFYGSVTPRYPELSLFSFNPPSVWCGFSLTYTVVTFSLCPSTLPGRFFFSLCTRSPSFFLSAKVFLVSLRNFPKRSLSPFFSTGSRLVSL